MRIQSVCLLLVLVSAAALSRDVEKKESIKERYDKFINQHINENMSDKRCDAEIRKRKISFDNKMCKPKNTFIRASNVTVKSVCMGEGEPYNGQTRSTEHFDIVVCELKKNKGKYPNCHYNGKTLNRRIIIKCEIFPVHYEGDIDYFEN
ncbi:ribonuclease-like 3 [Scomber japonicus]|uniref:ribonuclease-like 3 n=1 Tax=Scomber japonicus TaxID=13676 RepID=UPI00230543D3|nr:ribonuclease-like 3 [Scomber japonicus]